MELKQNKTSNTTLDATNRQIKSEKYYRSFRIRAEDINKTDRTVALSFASEQPVQQWYGTESLVISPATVDLTRIADGVCPLLLNHDPDQQIGIVQSATVENARVKSLVRFSQAAAADEIYTDVQDGIRQGVSFGYLIDDYTETDTGIIVNHLTVFEVSICSVPADSSVGVNRELNTKQTKERIMETETKVETVQAVAPVAPVVSNAERDAIITATRSGEMKRINEIDAIATGNISSTIPSIRELAKSAKEKGESVEAFRASVLDEINKRQAPVTTTTSSQFTATDTKDFSISRAINASISGDWSSAKYEREMMDHAAHKAGRSLGGVYLPYEVLAAKRAMSTTTATGAVQTVARPDLWVNPLYANSVTGSLGATVLNGLNGMVVIPKTLTSIGASSVAEGSAVTEVDPTFGSLTLMPNAIASTATYSKQLLIQSESNIDNIIVNDILKIIPLKLDSIAIAKLLSDSTVNQITCAAAVAYSHILKMEAAVLNANVNTAGCAYVTSPALAADLKQTLRTAGVATGMIWEGTQVNGYKALANTQLNNTASPAVGQMIFGDFSELYVAYFGNGLEVITDPISLASSMQVKVTASLFADCGLRHGQAFSRITDAVIS